jgi:hypothetical protein
MTGFGAVPNPECENKISVDSKGCQLMRAVFIDSSPYL